MINCIIIDDELHAIDLLVHYIDQVSYLHLVGKTTDAVEGLSLIQDLKEGLVFLDVQMPNLTGLEILQSVPKGIRVIMTTAYRDYAVEGFDHAVLDYLLKPIGFPRFLKAVERAAELETVDSKDNEDSDGAYLFVKTELKGKFKKIDVQHIDFIEGMGNYVMIHVKNESPILTYLTMKDMEQRLSDAVFIRIHRSYIIPLNRVSVIEGNSLKIHGVERLIPIGNMYKRKFFEKIDSKIISR